MSHFITNYHLISFHHYFFFHSHIPIPFHQHNHSLTHLTQSNRNNSRPSINRHTLVLIRNIEYRKDCCISKRTIPHHFRIIATTIAPQPLPPDGSSSETPPSPLQPSTPQPHHYRSADVIRLTAPLLPLRPWLPTVDELRRADVQRHPCTEPMATVYCLNGGHCYNYSVAAFAFPSCRCAVGFLGERCENKYPERSYDLEDMLVRILDVADLRDICKIASGV